MFNSITLAMGKILNLMYEMKYHNTHSNLLNGEYDRQDWNPDGGANTTGTPEVNAGEAARATAEKVNEVLRNIVGPCLSVIGSIGIIYMIVLGVQYAKAESDEKRAETKKRIVNLAIGVVIMIVMITLCFAIQWDSVIPDLFSYIPSHN